MRCVMRIVECICPPPSTTSENDYDLDDDEESISFSSRCPSEYEQTVSLNACCIAIKPADYCQSIDVHIKPVYRSPIDTLGYPDRCCFCVPLKIGVFVICFASFMYALVELVRSEKSISAIVPDKDEFFKIAKWCHLTVIVAYLLSCGILLIGVYSSKYKAINVYVWVAIIFNCICIVVIVTSLLFQIMKTGMTKRLAVIMVWSVAWYSGFFYFISVVNSYKYRLMLSDLLCGLRT